MFLFAFVTLAPSHTWDMRYYVMCQVQTLQWHICVQLWHANTLNIWRNVTNFYNYIHHINIIASHWIHCITYWIALQDTHQYIGTSAHVGHYTMLHKYSIYMNECFIIWLGGSMRISLCPFLFWFCVIFFLHMRLPGGQWWLCPWTERMHQKQAWRRMYGPTMRQMSDDHQMMCLYVTAPRIKRRWSRICCQRKESGI